MLTILGNAAHAPYTNVLGADLTTCLNHTEFTNLYDLFRIDMVKVQFYLKIDPSAQTAATASFPRLYWYRDTNDQGISPGTFLNEVRENSKGKRAVMNPNKPVTIMYRPNTLSETYRTSISTGYSPKFGQWIGTDTPNMTHYGIKYAIDDLTNTNYKVEIELTYHLSMKQSR